MAYESLSIIVVLYELEEFRGRRMVVVEDCPDLRFWTANINRTDTVRPRSLGIHLGPNFNSGEEYKVSFHTKREYRGAQLVLGPGAYADLDRPYNFGGVIESVKFGQGIANAPAVNRIPLVAELFDQDHGGRGYDPRIILHDVPDLETYDLFRGYTQRVIVYAGPDHDPREGKKVRLYTGKNYSGDVVELGIGDHTGPVLGGFSNGYVGSIRVS